MDPTGSVYIAGKTNSLEFPITPGAFEDTFRGPEYDAFVIKLSPAGDRLIYSTYLGGSGDDRGNGIALDSSGNAYVAGMAWTSNFPTTAAAQPTWGGDWDGIAFKLTDTPNHPPVLPTAGSIAVNKGTPLPSNLVTATKQRSETLRAVERDLAEARASQAAARSASLINLVDSPTAGTRAGAAR